MADRPLRPATRRCLGRPLPHQQADRPRGPPGAPERFLGWPCDHPGASGISQSFPWLSRSPGQVPHVLLTRSPLDTGPKAGASFDLHVLSTPPAFVLSQDQTLRRDLRRRPRPGHRSVCSAALPPRRVREQPCVQRAGLSAWVRGDLRLSRCQEHRVVRQACRTLSLTDIASSHAARADARTRCASVSSVFKKQSSFGGNCGTGQNRPDRTDGTATSAAPKGPARGGWPRYRPLSTLATLPATDLWAATTVAKCHRGLSPHRGPGNSARGWSLSHLLTLAVKPPAVARSVHYQKVALPAAALHKGVAAVHEVEPLGRRLHTAAIDADAAPRDGAAGVGPR